MVKNIVFDFGGVLVDWNPHYLYDKHFGSREKADWFLENICTGRWNIQMDGGKPFAEGCAELSAKYPEWTKEIYMFFERWIEMMADEIPGMRKLLGELKAAGYGLYGLTNWSAETFCQVRDRYEVFSLLDGMVVSGEEHIVKPDEAIFKRLLERYGLNAAECIFVDDLQRNVDGAIQAGLQGLLFRGAESLREDFTRLGILD
jgi:2-haloacid dehalogenase